MSSRSFIRIVKNYENISKLGREIIKHKEIVSAVPKSDLDIEFRNQEIRIQEFSDAIKKAETEWAVSHNSANTFWTGLS